MAGLDQPSRKTVDVDGNGGDLGIFDQTSPAATYDVQASGDSTTVIMEYPGTTSLSDSDNTRIFNDFDSLEYLSRSLNLDTVQVDVACTYTPNAGDEATWKIYDGSSLLEDVTLQEGDTHSSAEYSDPAGYYFMARAHPNQADFEWVITLKKTVTGNFSFDGVSQS